MWIRKLFRIGGTLAVTFPKSIVEKYNLSEKDYVVITQMDEKEFNIKIVEVNDVVKVK
jgi:antitoxin component of MazEF toxin-antitoxin module